MPQHQTRFETTASIYTEFIVGKWIPASFLCPLVRLIGKYQHTAQLARPTPAELREINLRLKRALKDLL